MLVPKNNAVPASVVRNRNSEDAKMYPRNPIGVTRISSISLGLEYWENVLSPLVTIGLKATPDTRYEARLML